MRRLTASIDIEAPPDQVWDIITDFSSYADWNPMFVGGSGSLTPGSTLALRMPMSEGGRPFTFTTTVLTADPGRLLRWGKRLIRPEVFDAVHEFALTPTETGTRVVQQETLRGALVPPLAALAISRYEKTFRRLNEALKARAEAEQIHR